MSSMTFESVHGIPRRSAARRIHSATPRLKAVPTPGATPPLAITAASNAGGAKHSRNQIGLIVGAVVVLVLHAAVIAFVSQPMEIVSIQHKAPLLTLDIAPPPPPPLPEIKPKPLQQIAETKPVVRQPPVKQASTPVPVVQSLTESSSPSADTVQVAVAAVPTPPPPPVPEPVTEPRGYAGYLNNPAPNYPLAAQKHGLQGKVVLKIHVLTNGQPDNISIAKSSGYAVLDEAAVKAVTTWVFEPAKRGKTAIDGWVNVPINFNLS